MAAATLAAGRGHDVTLFEAEAEIGGQFNMAKVIPGKEDYAETIRYFKKQIEVTQVQLILNTKVTAEILLEEEYDEVILATGVTPRIPEIEGIEHPSVLSYADVLYNGADVGKRVAIIGAGGIGFDVAEYLAHEGESPSFNTKKYMEEWGVDMSYSTGGAVAEIAPSPSPREIFLLKRSGGKHGKDLGKTTGWIHRASLAMKKVNMLGNVVYKKIDDSGLHITGPDGDMIIEVDNIVVCAGQEPLREMYEELKENNILVHIIGGADEAKELDAKRAINQASYLAAEI